MQEYVWSGIFDNPPGRDPSLPVSCPASRGGTPTPQMDFNTGKLRASCGFELTAQKYNLALNFFYDGSSENAEYGQRRSASTRARIVSSTSSYNQRNLMTGAVNADGTRSTYTHRYDKKRQTAQEPGGSVSTMIWDGKDYLGEV